MSAGVAGVALLVLPLIGVACYFLGRRGVRPAWVVFCVIGTAFLLGSALLMAWEASGYALSKPARFAGAAAAGVVGGSLAQLAVFAVPTARRTAVRRVVTVAMIVAFVEASNRVSDGVAFSVLLGLAAAAALVRRYHRPAT